MTRKLSMKYDTLMKALEFDEDQQKKFYDRVQAWDVEFRPFVEEVRKGQQVSEQDLQVVVNVKDYE